MPRPRTDSGSSSDAEPFIAPQYQEERYDRVERHMAALRNERWPAELLDALGPEFYDREDDYRDATQSLQQAGADFAQMQQDMQSGLIVPDYNSRVQTYNQAVENYLTAGEWYHHSVESARERVREAERNWSARSAQTRLPPVAQQSPPELTSYMAQNTARQYAAAGMTQAQAAAQSSAPQGTGTSSQSQRGSRRDRDDRPPHRSSRNDQRRSSRNDQGSSRNSHGRSGHH
ncbi:hypothetical protein [Streptomyces sp. NPDC088789]|uniref:hypothetical protein n=1 Tax=Streptomyces sp. NPDC088789 TaxID=3365899 RepID=UPI0037FC19E1